MFHCFHLSFVQSRCTFWCICSLFLNRLSGLGFADIFVFCSEGCLLLKIYSTATLLFSPPYIFLALPYILLYIASSCSFSETRAPLFTNWDTNEAMSAYLPACLHCLSTNLSAGLPTSRSPSVSNIFSPSNKRTKRCWVAKVTSLPIIPGSMASVFNKPVWGQNSFQSEEKMSYFQQMILEEFQILKSIAT